MTEWESVTAPRGQYIGWGNTPGQHVTGKVLAFDASGGKDPNGNPCPELTVELTERAASFRQGQRTDIEPGNVVQVTCAQVSLKRDIIAARLNPGDLIKITLEKLVPTAKSPAKVFDVKVARNSAPAPVETLTQPAAPLPPQQPAFSGGGFNDQPPF